MICTLFLPYAYGEDDIGLYAKATILIDQKSGRILYEKNANEERPFASLTKMMTFLLALEAIENNRVSKNDMVKISDKAAKTGGSSYKLRKNEEVEFIELVKALMIVSGNDAAVAIAEHVGGDVKDFVKMMNDKAKSIGISHTFFINPHGLPVYDMKGDLSRPKENISSAKELALLSKYLLDHYREEVLSITSMKTYCNDKRNFIRSNTNRLLYIIPQVDGLKTGYSGQAGYCLAFTMNVAGDKEDEGDFRLIGITLGARNSSDRTKVSKKLLEYGKNNFIKKRIVKQHDLISTIHLWDMDNLPIHLKAKNDLWVLKGKKETLDKKVILTDLSYPIKKGEKIGELKFMGKNKEVIGNVDLVSDTEIKWVPLHILFKLIKKQIFN